MFSEFPGRESSQPAAFFHKMLECLIILALRFPGLIVSGTRSAFKMIQGKTPCVLLGGFSHPEAICLQIGGSLWALALGSVFSLVWDTFSMWLGITASELPDLETWLNFLDQALNQIPARCSLGTDSAALTFSDLAKPCVIALIFFLFWSMLIYLCSIEPWTSI